MIELVMDTQTIPDLHATEELRKWGNMMALMTSMSNKTSWAKFDFIMSHERELVMFLKFGKTKTGSIEEYVGRKN